MICKQLHGDLMRPGWLTWFVWIFLFLQVLKPWVLTNSGLDPSQLSTYLPMKTWIYRHGTNIFVDVINKHILYIKHTRSLHLYFYIYHINPHGVFFNTVLGSSLDPFLPMQDILLDLQGCRTITDTGIKRRLPTSLVKLRDDWLPSTYHSLKLTVRTWKWWKPQ